MIITLIYGSPFPPLNKKSNKLLWLFISQYWLFFTELRDINLQIWFFFFSHNCEFISRNSDFSELPFLFGGGNWLLSLYLKILRKSQDCEEKKVRIVSLYLKNLWRKKVRIVSLYLKNLWRKKVRIVSLYLKNLWRKKVRIVSLYLKNLWRKKVRIVSLYLKNLWRKKVRIVSLYLKNLWRKKVRIVSLYLKNLWGKKSEYFLYYSVAETGFHTHFRYLSLSKKKLWS